MRKPEIQPPTPLILARPHIRRPLRLVHAPPDGLLVLVAPDIVGLGQQEDENGQDVDGEKLGVAVAVVGLVGLDVDEGVGYVAYLDGYLLPSQAGGVSTWGTIGKGGGVGERGGVDVVGTKP